MSPAPSIRHQHIVMALASCLHLFARSRGDLAFTAPTDVKFSEHDVLQPDIVYVTKDRADIVGEAMLDGAPDLVVEVLSPSTAYHDLRGKMRIYESGGVREYWVIDPEERDIDIHENGPNGFQRTNRFNLDDTLTSALLEGFSVPLHEILA